MKIIDDEFIILSIFAIVGTVILLLGLRFFGLMGVAHIESYKEENPSQEISTKLLVKEGAKIIGISKGNPYIAGYFILKDIEDYGNWINKSLNRLP